MSRYPTKTKIRALLGAAVLSSVLCGAPFAAELTPESYCQLAVQSMELQLSKLRTRAGTARSQRSQGPAVLEAYDQHVKAVEELDLTRLYARYGLTAEEYVTYLGRNKGDVDAYLAANPAVRERIDALSAKIHAALNDLETLRQP